MGTIQTPQAPAPAPQAPKKRHRIRNAAIVFGAVILVLAIIGIATGNSNAPKSHTPAVSSTPAAPSSSPATTAPSAPALTAAEQHYVNVMRHRFHHLVAPVDDSALVTFGGGICLDFQNGTSTSKELAGSQTWSDPVQPSRLEARKYITLTGRLLCPRDLRAAQHLSVREARIAAAKKAAAKRRAVARHAAWVQAHSVTYVVTGSPAEVTYGPAGSSWQGTVPMYISQRIANAAYYAISAQLQGGGSVTCKILVGGKVISRGSASGGYNIAMCEIVQDPIYGGWQDANMG